MNLKWLRITILSKRNSWLRGPAKEDAFRRFKEELTKPTVLTLYDPNAPTKILADASSHGLGAVLLQHNGSNWRPIAYASWAMSDTECHYAQIEKETVATIWASKKFAGYILGKWISIKTDHKPLVPILGIKRLDNLPPRVLRFRLRLNRFNHSISCVLGKYMYIADTLSQTPIPATLRDTDLQDLAESLVEMCVNHLPASNQRLEEYHQAQGQDHICSAVINYCKNGWPAKEKVDADIKPYWNAWGELTVHQGLLLYGKWIVIPNALQKEMLTKNSPRPSRSWDVLTSRKAICLMAGNNSANWQLCEAVLSVCEELNSEQQWSKQNSLISHGSDLFVLNGVSYLLIVDYFSRFPEIFKLKITIANFARSYDFVISLHEDPNYLTHAEVTFTLWRFFMGKFQHGGQNSWWTQDGAMCQQSQCEGFWAKN